MVLFIFIILWEVEKRFSEAKGFEILDLSLLQSFPRLKKIDIPKDTPKT